MPRGLKSALTVRLTPADRQTLQAWQRAPTHRRGAGAPGADYSPARGGEIDQHDCRDGRDWPPLCLQMGAAVSGDGPGGLGR